MDWIPAITTTSVLALALWLFRSVIVTRLAKSVQHEFDIKLESLRADIRKSEELFRADLRSKERQIETLQSGALSGLATRQAALDKRRFEAVDQLWSAVNLLGPAKAASAWMSVVKFEAAAKEGAKDPRIREIFKIFDTSNPIQLSDAHKARPYVSQIAWALFSAYSAIVMSAVLKLKILQSGLDMSGVLDESAVTKLIKAALPHRVEYINQYGTGAAYYLLDELETRLLEELQNILQGRESDKATIDQAAAILKESEQVRGKLSQATSS